jgi:hypothetical protein
MGYVYRLKEKKVEISPELKKLRKDLYEYEKIISRIDDTVRSRGKNYDKLCSLSIDLKKSFNALKKYSFFLELPNAMEVEKTLEDIDYERGKECTREFKTHTPLDPLDYCVAGFMGIYSLLVGFILLDSSQKSPDPFLKFVSTVVGYYLALGPISLPLTKLCYDLLDRIEVFMNNRAIRKFYSNREKKVKKYSKRLVEYSKPLIKHLKEKVKV